MNTETDQKLKHLIFAPLECSIILPSHLFAILENVERFAKKGDYVTLIYCDGKNINHCWVNTTGKKCLCRQCLYNQKLYFKTLSSSVKTVPVSEFFNRKYDSYSKINFEYNSVADIKKLEYNEVKIGYAAFSTYITETRNLYPLIDAEFKKYFNTLLKTALINTDIVNTALDKFCPDVVGSFNSRITISRPIYDTCQVRKFNINVFEVSGDNITGFRINNFYNNTPHGVEHGTERILHFWDSDFAPTEKKTAIAEKFFDDRRNAIAAGDKIYVKEQVKGLLPDNWDDKKHNIVIFNSSEDEFASLGSEFEHNFFPSQYQGIKFLFEKYKDEENFHFYLRVHPNLKNVNYAYHKNLYELGKISNNVTVIPANSPVSTYSLIDSAEKIVVFGSTTGAEAVYWGKPVILLSRCWYSLLDICYFPNTFEELDELIKKQNLEPKEKSGALKYAYYLINTEREPFIHYKYEIKNLKVSGQTYKLYKWITPKHWYLKNVSMFLRIIGGAYRKIKCPVPIKENEGIFL